MILMEFISNGELFSDLISLECSISSPNPDATEDINITLLQCPTWNTIPLGKVVHQDVTSKNKYLSTKIKHYQGIKVEVMQDMRNLCCRLYRKPVYTTNSGGRPK
jgi:hypothetical protein